MKYIGMHLHHDSSITVIDDDGNLELYLSLERMTRKKHCFDLAHREFNAFDFLRQRYDLKNCYIFLDNMAHATMEFLRILKNREYTLPQDMIYDVNKLIIVGHHVAHTCSAWMFRQDDTRKTFISMDGSGHCANHNWLHSMVGEIGPDGLRVLDYNNPVNSTNIFHRFIGGWAAGKLMGMAGYFDAQPYNLTSDEIIKYQDSKSLKTEDDYKKLAGFYRLSIDTIKSQLIKTLQRYDTTNGIVISGGTSLALEANTHLYNNITKNIVFGPPTDDSGISLGAACYGYWLINKKWPKKLSDPFIHYAEGDELLDESRFDIKELAGALNSNKVIGIIRGRAEAGPRALGHRSILASPCDSQMLHKVSVEIKEREFYRPLAPIVTDRQFDELFIGPRGNYMQYRVECTVKAQQIIPSVVHKDNTSRPQVVTQQSDPWLYELLTEFGKLSGVECLINTSLNSKGKPICNNMKQAVDDFRGKDIMIR